MVNIMSKKKKKAKILIQEKQIKNKNSSFIGTYFIIAGIIFFIFALIYGLKILNPLYEKWTLVRSDLMQHYVGWEGYRKSDWTFPIGLMDSLSYPQKISIIYTDSIPILAFFFKLISFMLPKTFQYFGWYALICYILQGILSAKIIKRFTSFKSNVIVGSLIFTLVPSMIFRMFYHTALGSQWLILLAIETVFLYDDYKEGNKIYYIWGIISFLISTIHIYYLPMCGIILVGYILLDILNSKKIKKSIFLLIDYIGVALISIFLFGGFTNLTKSDNFGFGLFSYNLNGIFNSMGYSTIVPELSYMPNQYEGFSYLGLGVILLLLIAIVLSIVWIIKDRKIIKNNKNLIISLCTVSIISVILAVSPKVYLGKMLLSEMKLPEVINNIWGIFRSTGRMIWPLINIIMISSIIIILKRLNWKASLLILIVCFFVQVIDLGEMLMEENNKYSNTITINEEYDLHKNETLKKISSNEKIKLIVFSGEDFYDSDIIVYTDWALDNDMKVNTFHFARENFTTLLAANTEELLKEKDETKVYIFGTIEECNNEGLFCYRIPYDYVMGYINSLN